MKGGSRTRRRLVAWQADDTTDEEIIGVAEAMTCIDLRRKLEACAAHHLHGVHKGWIRVRGVAPARLVWELGARGFSALRT
ncbi:MAG: hypothetical protein E6J63_23670 [Deltaproteobacteria bacterium]|nr:MAG: hypothetical protein E6J63_23670 [Deltaproteobacteria bacterium]